MSTNKRPTAREVVAREQAQREQTREQHLRGLKKLLQSEGADRKRRAAKDQKAKEVAAVPVPN